MTPNERAGLLGEVRRLLGVPVGDVYRRTPLPGELPGPVPTRPYRKRHWWLVLAHPPCPVGESCGCPREIRGHPHAAPVHAGPTGLLRNPQHLSRVAERMGRQPGSRPLTASDGHSLMRLLHEINDMKGNTQ